MEQIRVIMLLAGLVMASFTTIGLFVYGSMFDDSRPYGRILNKIIDAYRKIMIPVMLAGMILISAAVILFLISY